MFLDLGLFFDAATRRADLALGSDWQPVLDETAVTPMLVAIGSDRLADPDDPLPAGRSELNQPALAARRGWPGDALDASGRRLGSKVWLLDRAKATEETRAMFEFWLREALAWAVAEGRLVKIAVSWERPGLLGFAVAVDGTELAARRSLG
jgi:phage gp46-like protein